MEFIESPFTIYAIKCDSGKWYVGMTQQFNNRMYQHWNGKGARWTQKHKPIKAYPLFEVKGRKEALAAEDKVTLRLMDRFGSENVRGGQWCS